MSDSANNVVQNCEYYLRIVTIFQVCIKQALLDILHDPQYNGLPVNNEPDTHGLLLAFKQSQKGQDLSRKRVLKPSQWDIICHECTNCAPNCPRAQKTNTQDFDITIICVLLSNYLTGLPPPTNGWTRPLAAGDYSKGACGIRARDLRNYTTGHGSYQQIATQQDFDNCYNKVERILIGLGYNNMPLFTDLKTSSLDPYVHDRIKFLSCDLNTMKSKISTVENEQVSMKIDQHAMKTDIDSLSARIEFVTDILLCHLEQSCDRRNIETTSVEVHANSNLNLVSEELKEKYKNKYESLNLALEPRKTAFEPVHTIERNNIVVRLSLVPSPAVFEMNDENQYIEMMQKKHKDTSSFFYKDIFESNNDYVMISGVPGCGKTTLVETILYDWSTGKLWKEEFDFVFIIYFRQLVKFRLHQNITCHKLLSHFYPGFDFSNLSHYKSLLILDGFDEFACKEDFKNKPETFSPFVQAVYDLVDPEYSSIQFTRLLTSRPGSCPILFESVFNNTYEQNLRIFKIIGFDEQNINQYVYNHLQNADIAETFMVKIKESSLLQNFMTIPFFCWGICYLINNKEITVEKLPLTTTSIYANILTLFIRNHGLRNPSAKLTDLFQEQDFQEMIFMLCKMAWILYEKRKLIFSSNDLEEFGEINVLLQSGLVIKVESDCDEVNYFQFMHYSFQEFLCALNAFYASENLSYLNSNIRIMVVGLCGGKIQNSSSNTLVKLYASMTNSDYNFTSFFNDRVMIGEIVDWFHEFQNETSMVYIENLRIDVIFDLDEELDPAKSGIFIKRCEDHQLSVGTLFIDGSSLLISSVPKDSDYHAVIKSILACTTTLECDSDVLFYIHEKYDFRRIKEVCQLQNLYVRFVYIHRHYADSSEIIDAIENLKRVKILVLSEDKDKKFTFLERIKLLANEMSDSERPLSITFHHVSGGKLSRQNSKLNPKSIFDDDLTNRIHGRYFKNDSYGNNSLFSCCWSPRKKI